MEQVTSTYDLLARIGQGDEAAFTTLFEKYQNRLALLIHYKLSPGLRRMADVDDVLQETFFEAFRDLKQFRYQKPGGFLGWLSRIP
jgi:DNA-directed RNA polymerase specialized sigma24 family protein